MWHGASVQAAAIVHALQTASLGARMLGTQRLRVTPRTQPVVDAPLRVLYVWDDEYPWDVRTEKICGTLTRAGHDVHIVARNAARRELREALPEGTVHRMRPWRWLSRELDARLAFPAFFSPRWLALLLGTSREVRPDVMIVRDLPLAPTAIWVGALTGTPVVLDMAENYPAMLETTWRAGRQQLLDIVVRNPMLARGVERYVLARADRILVVVDESEQRLRSLGVGAERIEVVSNTPPLEQAASDSRVRNRAPGDELELVYLGYLEIPRGIGELIEAVARLRAADHAVTLTLIGDGRDAGIFRAQARRLGLGEDVIRFLGYLPHARALEIVARADVGVVPHQSSEYWNTTIPNKLFDYMAAGLPVIASDVAPTARIIRETGAGQVYRSGDPSGIVEAVLHLLDPAERLRVGERGRQAIRHRYHWERDAATLLEAVSRTAGASARVRAA